MKRLVNLLTLTTGKVTGIAAIGFVIGIIALNHYRPDITGFGSDSTTNVERNAKGEVIKTVEIGQSGKSLWDWLSVLGVPLTLALLGYWLQQLQQQRVDEEVKEEVLQNYFDRISTLLIDKNLIAVAIRVEDADKKKEEQQKAEQSGNSQPQLLPQQTLSAPEEESLREDRELVNAAKDVIRGRTLSILRRLGDDPKRKENVIRFLAETEIVSRCRLDLSGINLVGVDLSWANLSRVNLCKADLRRADLSCAILSGAKLVSTKLINAKLVDANLKCANLSGADLRNTDLRANLSDADLGEANIRRATLRGANLTNATLWGIKGWSNRKLSKAQLCYTSLPEGSKLDPNRDCK